MIDVVPIWPPSWLPLATILAQFPFPNPLLRIDLDFYFDSDRLFFAFGSQMTCPAWRRTLIFTLAYSTFGIFAFFVLDASESHCESIWAPFCVPFSLPGGTFFIKTPFRSAPLAIANVASGIQGGGVMHRLLWATGGKCYTL